MQVNSSSGPLQQRFFSGTGSIGGTHLPDFNVIPPWCCILLLNLAIIKWKKEKSKAGLVCSF